MDLLGEGNSLFLLVALLEEVIMKACLAFLPAECESWLSGEKVHSFRETMSQVPTFSPFRAATGGDHAQAMAAVLWQEMSLKSQARLINVFLVFQAREGGVSPIWRSDKATDFQA